jgi:hypothetical protein
MGTHKHSKHKDKYAVDWDERELTYHDKRYSWWPKDDDGDTTHPWCVDGKTIKSRKRIKRLEAILAKLENRKQSKAASASESADEPDKSTHRKKKGSRSDDLKETGQDSHGRIWLYDREPQNGKRWYGILEFSQDTKKPGIVKAQYITTGKRATYLYGEPEMTLLLKRISKVYKDRYGEKKMLKIIYPNSRVIKTEKK